MAQPFLGQIMQVGFGFAPIDWAQAAGQTLAISQNAALFSLLGTTFGGNGTSTFQLPNVQGRVIVGVGQTPGLSTYVWGEIGGAEQVTLNLSQMPTHTHAAAVTQPTATLSALSGVATGATVPSNIPTANARLSNTIDTQAATGYPQIYAPAGTAGTPVNLGGLSISNVGVTNALAGGNVPFQISTALPRPVDEHRDEWHFPDAWLKRQQPRDIVRRARRPSSSFAGLSCATTGMRGSNPRMSRGRKKTRGWRRRARSSPAQRVRIAPSARPMAN